MADKIIGLDRKEYKPPKENEPKPNKEIIEWLEQMLEGAKKGEVQEVVATYHYKNTFYNSYYGFTDNSWQVYGMLNDLAQTYREVYILGLEDIG